MPKEKIAKHLDRSEWSVGMHIEFMSSGREPVNPEWEQARREAMEDAGLELDDAEGLKPPGERSVAEEVEGMRATTYKVAD